ncbi:Alpha/Beta hydrolase protein [Bipolaris maydis]|nr:Alpha/Beta hydrolase protein [Bipolaris maydis]KAJ5060682.1 Alpha/Beta hydrolase protein [Bipolaris maydis]KAJ6197821.1 Alpha/Beta hydrolase protein [Bipolaris maydis]KAJ6281406.1 Alpha/Beta hydrolase protein [Bipolaris maydis]
MIFIRISSLLLLMIFDTITCKPFASTLAPTVTIQNGTLVGSHHSAYNQDFFLGIPFAAPPIGELRLRRPAPPTAWTGRKKADTYSNWCMSLSLGLPGFSQNATEPISEDCLYLNIVRPAGIPANAKLPVMAWIHGGGFLEGSANDPRYNGSFIVQKSVQMGSPVIFASFNYRMGAFGMLAGAAAEKEGITNIFLRDQRQALAWIQENIAEFGGDPARVMIFGESAGAVSIGCHLYAYGGRDDRLFSAAILESGGSYVSNLITKAEDKEASFQAVLNATNCSAVVDPIACLRQAPAASLLMAASQPISVDGDVFLESGAEAMAQGHFVRVPTIIGNNRNEGTTILKIVGNGPVNDYDDFHALMQNFYRYNPVNQTESQTLWDLYQTYVNQSSNAGLGTVLADQGPAIGTSYGLATLVVGDFSFILGRRSMNQAFVANGVPTYSYFFDTQTSNLDPKRYGVAHFQEIPFVFNNWQGVGWDVDPIPQGLEEPSYRRLAETMSRMWISFAVTHSPNNHKLPYIKSKWPAYAKQDPHNFVFTADGVSTQADTYRNEAQKVFLKLQL